MRWILALLAALSAVLVFMPLRFRYSKKEYPFWNLTFKVIPTLMCAAFGGTAFFRSGDPYALFIFIGLCIGAAADVVLGIHFITGGVLFLAGHLFYMTAFCIQQPLTWWSLPVLLVSFGLLCLFLYHFRSGLNRKMTVLAHVYSLGLSVVLCMSLPMPFLAFSQRTLLAALGAFIFVLSDMGVCHGIVCRISRRRDMFYLGIYYLAQLLLALSAF